MGETAVLVGRFYELVSAGDVHQAVLLFDPACRSIVPGGEIDQVEHETKLNQLRLAFPDLRFTVDRMLEIGQEAVVIGRCTGVHAGDIVVMGTQIPASSASLELRFFDYFTSEAGCFVNHQTSFDQLELIRQMGATVQVRASDRDRSS